ncbi:hypothetical protein FJT64_012761 [Amphibalanus amphitrite]|uniref:Uncharacterized protein n=1 Tax=Amphibalanus amphitrite TaxID=1232801 RepID=A0A6A4VEN5_AMPAM|nr:uncharacterized protein LOC122375075 [Amphibalanus amphitrite]KAF0288868.1 hypothetical protein FJT64_012761 [Amphibalanus amphitrite]
MNKYILAALICASVAVAASGTLQKRDTEYALNDDETYYNNYYNHQNPRPVRRNKSPFGWLSRIVSRASGGYDTGYSGYSGSSGGYGYSSHPQQGGGKGDLLGPLFLLGLGLLAALALGSLLAFLFTQLNGSGRGLDTDEWEVDHSVWMDQLQKDFEDSWSEE